MSCGSLRERRRENIFSVSLHLKDLITIETIYRNALNVKRYTETGAFVGSVRTDHLGLAVKVPWLYNQTNPIQDLMDTLAGKSADPYSQGPLVDREYLGYVDHALFRQLCFTVEIPDTSNIPLRIIRNQNL